MCIIGIYVRVMIITQSTILLFMRITSCFHYIQIILGKYVYMMQILQADSAQSVQL